MVSKPASTWKQVLVDNGAANPSEMEIDLRTDGIPQETILSDRQRMKEICDRVGELKDESKLRRMREDLKRGNHLSEETSLEIRQMGNVEIYEQKTRM